MNGRRAAPKAAAGLALLTFALLAAGPATTLFADPTNVSQQFSERWQFAEMAGAPSQPNARPQPTPAPAAAKPEAAASSDKPPALPVSLDQALYLIRTTLLTLNDANRSGNYTVLRDLAAPDFQANNTAADLAQGFADLRRRRFDLFAAALAAPQLTSTPVLDAEKRLRLQGSFSTRPLQISFDLLFQNVSGQWRLFGMSVTTPQAPAEAQIAPAKAHQGSRVTSR